VIEAQCGDTPIYAATFVGKTIVATGFGKVWVSTQVKRAFTRAHAHYTLCAVILDIAGGGNDERAGE
jgi:hypothetical protein